jgi:mRNA interferase MazF
MSNFKRGEVHLVKPDPSIGKKIQKTRPCVIVSNDVANSKSDLVVVCPITDAAGKTPDVIHVAVKEKEGGLEKDSIVLCDQVKAVDQIRLVEKKGNLDADTMKKIDIGLRLLLNLHKN